MVDKKDYIKRVADDLLALQLEAAGVVRAKLTTRIRDRHGTIKRKILINGVTFRKFKSYSNRTSKRSKPKSRNPKKDIP